MEIDLETYGASLRAKPVDTITTDDVLAAISRPLRPKLPLGCAGGLRRSWMPRKPFREGENPARWRGHLDHLLPKAV